MDWTFVFSGITLAVAGLYVLRIGVLGIAKKRPLAFPARTFSWLLLLAILLIFVDSLMDLPDRWSPSILFSLLFMILIAFIFWREMKGYLVIGIYDRTFREALAFAMNKLNVRPQEIIIKRRTQETTTRIRLVELDADLLTTIAEWSGNARIQIVQREQVHLAKIIADGINAYYSSTSVKVNNFGFLIYLILGIFALGSGVVMAFAF